MNGAAKRANWEALLLMEVTGARKFLRESPLRWIMYTPITTIRIPKTPRGEISSPRNVTAKAKRKRGRIELWDTQGKGHHSHKPSPGRRSIKPQPITNMYGTAVIGRPQSENRRKKYWKSYEEGYEVHQPHVGNLICTPLAIRFHSA